MASLVHLKNICSKGISDENVTNKKTMSSSDDNFHFKYLQIIAYVSHINIS